jgi:hypothetical protein
MALTLSLLYRGPLSSCNYDCGYCPFAKRHETAAELAIDRQSLHRFVNWMERRNENDRLSVFFTPWGEALVRTWYREAITKLSWLPQIEKVAVQTNLSCRLDWLDACNKQRVALWCTYHPEQTSRANFLAQCQWLSAHGLRHSVGVVGLRHHFGEIEALRGELSDDVYLWINAYKDVADYYDDDEVGWLSTIDSLFPLNNARHPSLGKSCRTGESVISVDGEGNIRRCHFVKEVIGNLYDDDFADCLRPRTCPNATCGCHIGFVHLDELRLVETFAGGVLERIPDEAHHSLAMALPRRFSPVGGS